VAVFWNRKRGGMGVGRGRWVVSSLRGLFESRELEGIHLKTNAKYLIEFYPTFPAAGK